MDKPIIESEYPYVLASLHALGKATEQADIVERADAAIDMWTLRKGWGPFVHENARAEMPLFDENYYWRAKFPLNAYWTDAVFTALCNVTTQLILSWNDDRYFEEVSDFDHFFELFFYETEDDTAILGQRHKEDGQIMVTYRELECYLASRYAVADFIITYAKREGEQFIETLATIDIENLHSEERNDIKKALEEANVMLVPSPEITHFYHSGWGEIIENVNIHYDPQTKTCQMPIQEAKG